MISPEAAAVLTAIGAPVVLAALAPPPLPMFPPQGVPQPGFVARSGGALPATVFVVWDNAINIYILKMMVTDKVREVN